MKQAMSARTPRNRSPKLVISDISMTRLEALADGTMRRHPDLADRLLRELGRARIVPAAKLPPNVVDIGRPVTYRDESTGKEHTVTLVYPQDADISDGRISVATPVGIALIGLAENAVFHWDTRNGTRRDLKIIRVSPARNADGKDA